jgi:hypothetical protein
MHNAFDTALLDTAVLCMQLFVLKYCIHFINFFPLYSFWLLRLLFPFGIFI